MIEIRLIPAILFCSGSLSLFLAFYALHNRRSTLIYLFSCFAGCVTLYAFGYGLEMLSHTLEEMLLWSKVQYLGISFIPGLMLAIALSYSGNKEGLGPIKLGLILLIPLVICLARLSNPYHHLFYRSAAMIPWEYGALLKIEPGPFYLVHAVFSNLAWLVSFGVLIRFFFRTSGPYRRQIMIIILGSSIQWFGYMFYLTGLGPEGLDLNPLLLGLTVPVYAFGFIKFALFSLVPVARDQVFEEMRDAVVVTDNQLRLVDFNHKASRLFPRMVQENIGLALPQLFEGTPEISKNLKVRASDEVEVGLNTPEREQFFRLSRVPLSEKSKREMGYIFTFTDVTVQKEFTDKLERLATIDELTGIYNRRHLRSLADVELQRMLRSGEELTVLLLDLDHFKTINDTWGHQCGDQVLQSFAYVLNENIRAMDIFGRLGGEEFMILMPGTPKEKALGTARRLCQIVDIQPFNYEGHDIRFTVSIGVSGSWDLDPEKRLSLNLDHVIRKADRALYQAKQNGRNQAVMA